MAHGRSMIRRHGAALVASVAAIALLSGCLQGDDGATGTAAVRAGQSGAQPSVAVAESDAERPDVFDTQDRALWDGRPSLGGVWVAHPDVGDPERVIIRNPDTGQEVIGALFRRERHNPGPAFQVSADAAAALQMLAGAPTAIRVTALRTVEPAVQTVADAEPEADFALGARDETPSDDDAPVESDSAVAAAADVALPAPDTDAGRDMASAAEQASAPEATGAAAPAPERQPGLLGRLFGGGARSNATQAQMAADEIARAAQRDSDSAQVAFPDETGQSAAAEPPATPAAPARSAPTASSLTQPYIQLGIFSIEENARRAAGMAEGRGLSAQVIAAQSQGNAFWRVTVGPATDRAARDRLLAQVRALGFNDAYAVRR